MSDNYDLNEMEDIRAFLEERLQAADPALDVSPGSPMDTEVITPTVQRLGPEPFDSPILDFIRGRLESEYPDLILQDGDALDDTVVKIMRILLEPFRRQIKLVSQNQSLSDPELLNDEEADNLAANFFVTRRPGAFAVGIARLYFSNPQSQLITPSNPCASTGGLKFFPTENQAITSESMQLNTEGSLYYFDVLVRAEAQGEEYNIGIGELVSIDNVDQVVKVTNKNAFEEGADREDTESFLERVENSLAEKSLVTFRGINARLLDTFENISAIAVIGFGDPEMDRDVIRSSNTEPYGLGVLVEAITGATVTDVGNFYDNVQGEIYPTTIAAGDSFRLFDSSGDSTVHTVEEVISSDGRTLRVTPAFSSSFFGTAVFYREAAVISLSDIPGGILIPETDNGDIEITNNSIHIGGVLDVYVRAGFPQERTTTLSSIRDAEPLHFGVDLESFGADPSVFINITDFTADGVYVPATDTDGNPNTAELQIRTDRTGDQLWRPTEDDVGRYIQLRGGATANHGTFRIEEIIRTEAFWQEVPGSSLDIRIRISLSDEETGTTSTLTLSQLQDCRIKDKISVKALVRDRDASVVVQASPAVYAGINFRDGVGAQIGDSVVIETGADADIYTIRRILDSLADGDVLLLSQDLTATVTPNGTGDRSGLRYRIADSLDVNLVDPKTTKIPLGTIFPGDDLSTVAGSATVTVSGDTNFSLAGVAPGDILEILEGGNEGQYLIESVAGTSLEVTPAPQSTTFNVTFSVYTSFTSVERPLVRVKSVDLLDSSGQSTGISIPYGNYVDGRVKGTLSNRANGETINSYSGSILNSVTFRDSEADFQALNVSEGYRLTLLEGDNAGEYTIKSVLSATDLEIYPVSEGGTVFVGTGSNIHYRVGLPSSGFARLYFVEPTSVEIQTGLGQGQLKWVDGDITKYFRFSEVDGRQLLPAPGSGDDLPRDLRVVRYTEDSSNPGEYFTILEFTDTGNPDVFELELQEGDLIEVYEQLYLRDTTTGDTIYPPVSGVSDIIYAGPPVLKTVAGSDQVSIPANSVVGFNQMEAAAGGLIGHTLYIEDGPDAGYYTIEAVVDDKTLKLSTVMVGSTEARQAYSSVASGLSLTASGGDAILYDSGAGVNPAVGAETGHYITIFEIRDYGNDDAAGVWEITAVDVPGRNVTLSGCTVDAANPLGAGEFEWLRTNTEDAGVGFSIYKSSAKKVAIREVATRGESKSYGTATIEAVGSDVIRLVRTSGSFLTDGVEEGDLVEIMAGDNAGTYHAEVVTASYIDVFSEDPFAFTDSVGITVYRVWGGIHGNRRMVTVETYDGNDGQIAYGENMPYAIVRPGLFRVSSTEMEDNFDGALYYIDIQIESEGSGDDLNLDIDERLVVESGLEADGYTYEVENTTLTFSPYEEVSLKFDRRFLPVGNSDLPENLTEISARNLQIAYEMSPTVRIVDDLLHSDLDRPVNANPIARHFLPRYLYTTLTYRGGSSAAVVGPELESHVNALGATDELEVSDLETVITRRGAHSVEHPIELVVVTHDLNRDLIVDRSDNRLGGTEEVVSYEGSARTSSFFASTDEGLIVDRES